MQKVIKVTESNAIKKKMMAATSMLLVAVIMLVSASYAWFTLSTAPEITGITTAVGANGNLEIALADESTWSDPDETVSSNVGDSMASRKKAEANITWGNLVDLSADATDGDVYGLSGITLYPSRLNLKDGEDGVAVNTIPLWTPLYGYDGRVDSLAANTSYGIYDKAEDKFTISESDYGVRAIGSASGMTDRQLAYRTAKVDLANAISGAKVAAKKSLEDNGSALAEIIVAKAMSDDATYDATARTTIVAVIDALEDAQVELLEAWEAAIIAYAASAAGETTLTTEEAYIAFKAAFETSYTVDTTTGSVTTGGVTFTLPSTFATYYTEIGAIATDITAARNALPTEATSYTWADISTALYYLVDVDNVTINGIESSKVKDNMSALVAAVTGGSGIQVQMPSESGVYSDIADYAGDYSASIQLTNLTYNGIEVGTEENPVNATMTTVSNVSPAKLVAAQSAVNTAGAPAGAGAANNVLSDMFGYAIDFYVRTNAANSNLLLQVDPEQRIYGESTNDETQGSGSNMTFTTADTGFTSNQMLNLMDAIRIVLMDGEGTILSFAKLDTANAEVANSTVTADIKLCDVTYNQDEDDNYTSVTVGAFKADNAQVITSLPQNAAQKVSVLVYLDGDSVTNADVANAMQSMTGKMNIQFASSATLIPMDNTTLKGVTVTPTPEPANP